MKKLLLFSAVLVGAVSASQAGVNFNLGFGLPLPPLPGLVVSHSARVVESACAPAPVYVAPRVCEEPAVVVAPPVCEPRVEIRANRYARNYSVDRDHRGHWDRDQHSGHHR